MAGHELAIGALLAGGLTTLAGRISWTAIQHRRRVEQCPHPEHRLYELTHFWCDECKHEVYPVFPDGNEDAE